MKIKRTTVVLPEQVKKELKHVAADQDISLTLAITAAVLYFLEDYKSGRVSGEFFEKVRENLKELRESER